MIFDVHFLEAKQRAQVANDNNIRDRAVWQSGAPHTLSFEIQLDLLKYPI